MSTSTRLVTLKVDRTEASRLRRLNRRAVTSKHKVLTKVKKVCRELGWKACPEKQKERLKKGKKAVPMQAWVSFFRKASYIGCVVHPH